MGGVFSNIQIPVMMVTKVVGDLLFQEINSGIGKPLKITPSIVVTTGGCVFAGDAFCISTAVGSWGSYLQAYSCSAVQQTCCWCEIVGLLASATAPAFCRLSGSRMILPSPLSSPTHASAVFSQRLGLSATRHAFKKSFISFRTRVSWPFLPRVVSPIYATALPRTSLLDSAQRCSKSNHLDCRFARR